MKNRRIILTIISILITMASGAIFFLPTWYFTYTVNSSDITSTLTNKYINLLEFSVLEQVKNMYSALYLELPTLYANLFLLFVGITLLSSLIMTIIIIIALFKQLSPKTIKVFPIISITLSIITITLALIFSHEASQTINDNTLAMDITIGVYLFVILQVSGNACAYITSNLRDN